MQFWSISPQNGLKMCAFLRSITWETGCLWNRFKPVQIGPFVLFEKHATATTSPVLIGPVQLGFRSRDGKALHMIQSLKPLNEVTIQHSGVPPFTEQLAKHFAACTCGSMLDLYVGYDERALAESSRDYTTFQTPFRALWLTTLPMGWTNSVPIFLKMSPIFFYWRFRILQSLILMTFQYKD